ncbi:MAG: hypothetical protein H0U75_07205 [Legionella sp.]|nr:hypothetical protein [Legionella sp.]
MTYSKNEPLAIIGMACTVPGADNYAAFWEQLCKGKVCFEDLLTCDMSPDLRPKCDILNTEFFDAARYGINEQEALLMDPQLRQFLMLVETAFADSGYCSGQGLGIVGVVASQACNATYHDYLSTLIAQGQIAKLPELLENVNKGADFLATRTSYVFDLKGTAFNLQSGCSSSLVAVVEAAHLIWSKRCDAVVAGGITVTYPLHGDYSFQSGSIYSKTGVCRPFDADADGTVPASGGGVIIIKSLSKSLEDGDYVHAILRGAGSNNDGARKVSFSAPSIEGQLELLKQTYDNAGLSVDQLAFIECHATGTVVGDPIEVRALQRFVDSFQQAESGHPIYLGSVKGNIGHLFWSSGVISLIKSILALKHGIYPGTAGLMTTNPLLNIQNSPFVMSCKNTMLDLQVRNCCGVSSFGVGGTNAHIILEHVQSNPPSKAVSLEIQNLHRYTLVPNNHSKQLESVTTTTYCGLSAAFMNPANKSSDVEPRMSIIEKKSSSEKIDKMLFDHETLCLRMIDIYKNSLSVSDISVTSNYFDLYGDSITAVCMIADINKLCGVILSQDDIYKFPTPKMLACRIGEYLAIKMKDPVITTTLQKYLNPFQNRFYLLEKLQRGSFSNYNVPLCLKADTALDWDNFIKTLEEILGSIPAFTCRLKWTGAGIELFDRRERMIKADSIILSNHDDIDTYFRNFFGHRFDLEKGPSAIIVNVQYKNHHFLAINFPHLLMDGAGLENLLRKIERKINDHRLDLSDSIPPNEGQILRTQDQHYWQSRLMGLSPTSLYEADTGSHNASELSNIANEYSIIISKEIWDMSRQICRYYETTPFIVFYACLNLWLAIRTSDKKILTGTTLNNRDHLTLKHIDCRINNVPLAININNLEDFLGILEETKKSFSEAVLHSSMPLDSIVSSAKLRGSPYQILFMFHNQNRGYSINIKDVIWKEAEFRYKPLYAEVCLNFQVNKDQLILTTYYDKQRFQECTIRSMIDEYLRLSHHFINHLDKAILYA